VFPFIKRVGLNGDGDPEDSTYTHHTKDALFMMPTPRVLANLVFFKPVYSRIKVWQMIGRGTRLCPDLFGPGEDEQDFRVFDFFCENPQDIEAGGGVPLGTRLFRARVQLLAQVQATPERERQKVVAGQVIRSTEPCGVDVRSLPDVDVGGPSAARAPPSRCRRRRSGSRSNR